MAKQGVTRPKVVSSGRLHTGSGRGHIYKKKVAGRSLPPLEPAYSLYSTDSEDQVTIVHKGLDRCAALLNGILEAEAAESKPKSPGIKTTFKVKNKNFSRKAATDRKHEKKTNTGIHAKKKPVPVQRTILSSKSGIRGVYDAGLATITKTKPAQQYSVPPAQTQPANNKLSSLGEVQTGTFFNYRLTQSTPALSPRRPGSAQSEPCSSKWVQSHSNPSEKFPHPNPDQFSSSFPIPPAANKQYPVTPVTVHSPFQNENCIPVEQRVPFCDVPQMESVGSSVLLASSAGSLSCPLVAHAQECQAQSDTSRSMMLMGTKTQEKSDGGISAEDDNEEAVDTTPVRDISCQTSKEKSTDVNYKTISPEKTTRKVMTVRYLLGELKTLVANQDSEAVRLISEVEQSISLLPVMVGSTNIQAEIALALQPLRSENVQLRRRLRILNQQLLERERAERRARPEDCNMEVEALQSLNLALQTQLNESQREHKDLQQENLRLQKALENKENDWKLHKEQCEKENTRLRRELDEALAEMKSCQSKLQVCEFEKTAVTLSLQQGEADNNRLQEMIRNQNTQNTFSEYLDLPQPNSKLTKSVLELHENAMKNEKLNSSVKTYLQTLEETGLASPLKKANVLQQALPCDGGKERIMPSDGQVCSPKIKEIHNLTLETTAENAPQSEEIKVISFAPLRETLVGSLTLKNQKQGLNFMGCAFEKLDISGTKHNQESTHWNEHPMQSQHARRCLKMDVESRYTGRPSVMESTFSSCDIKSLASDWSVNSGSTFNTRDEQNFRDGLAALDASIASLQRTLKADLNK